MTTAETYVTAAYLVFLAVVCLYVVLYSFKISRLEQEVAELRQPPLEEEQAPTEERALAGSLQ